MERYAHKDEAYLKIHKSSKPFLEFRPKLKAMQDDGNVEITGESYMDTMIDFGDSAVWSNDVMDVSNHPIYIYWWKMIN